MQHPLPCTGAPDKAAPFLLPAVDLPSVVGLVGAARAGLIKALVTDEDTANGCLEVADAA